MHMGIHSFISPRGSLMVIPLGTHHWAQPRLAVPSPSTRRSRRSRRARRARRPRLAQEPRDVLRSNDMGYSQIIDFLWECQLETTQLLGYPHLWKPLYETNLWIDRWIDRYIDRQKDGSTDRQIDR